MQANWSLILNILLLMGVVIAIGRLMKARRRNLMPANYQPVLDQGNEAKPFDDIIAVRKLNVEELPAEQHETLLNSNKKPALGERFTSPVAEPELEPEPQPARTINLQADADEQSIMMFLLAKEERQLAGYELLQTILAAGLRFGEGQLFHRHQQANGQGPVLCSLAAATASGLFDLQNIGAFSVRGLCLFMQVSGNATIDLERFDIMYETAKQLSEELDTYLLDQNKHLISEASLSRYRETLTQ